MSPDLSISVLSNRSQICDSVLQKEFQRTNNFKEFQRMNKQGAKQDFNAKCEEYIFTEAFDEKISKFF